MSNRFYTFESLQLEVLTLSSTKLFHPSYPTDFVDDYTETQRFHIQNVKHKSTHDCAWVLHSKQPARNSDCVRTTDVIACIDFSVPSDFRAFVVGARSSFQFRNVYLHFLLQFIRRAFYRIFRNIKTKNRFRQFQTD